jgi:hypothetical protein
MSQDIVSEMMGQMNLSPMEAENLQNQQGSYAPMGEAPGMGMGMNQGLPTTPEEQMRLMSTASNPPPMQQPQYEIPQPAESYDDSSILSSSEGSIESNLDLAKVGLSGTQKTMMDTIGDYLRDPLLVIVFFVIISLTQVDTLIRKVLPGMITGNVHYYLGIKALIMGLSFLLSKLAFA